MFKEADTPPALWKEAKSLNEYLAVLQAKIKQAQKDCQHDWQPVKKMDPDYCDRVDGRGRGQVVITEYHCALCRARKAIAGFPWEVCRKCGGKMKYDRRELCGMDRVHIHKCQDCGSEYDTT